MNYKKHFQMIRFQDVKITDRQLIQSYTLFGERQNCDLSFANIISWRFLYNTEFAIVDDFLAFRFYTGNHLTYMAPLWTGDWSAEKQKGFANVVRKMHADSTASGHPFLMLGVCGKMTEILESAFPDTYHFKPDRDYADYIYDREKLANLPGKKLQSKRNHCNKFRKLFPNYEYRPLTKEMIPACLALQKQWRVVSKNEEDGENEFTNELRSMARVFDFWDDLDVVGGTIWVDGSLVAFTYGAPINQNTFDVCVEKADSSYDGAFSIINQEFVRHLPEQYTFINREEDLGIEGLRYAKLSYKPDLILEKYTVMEKRPLAQFEGMETVTQATIDLWRDTFNDREEFIQLYFTRVFRPEYNVVCQLNNEIVAALQTLPYQLKFHDTIVPCHYISGVSVREEYRRQDIGNNLLSQAHFRLYHQEAVFAMLIPAEEWLYGWYERCGYTRNIVCTPPPAGIDDMSFDQFDQWQRSKPCVVLHDEDGFDIVMEDRKLATPEELSEQAARENIPAMIRVISAEKAFALYAARHPEVTRNFRVYNDSDIPKNNMYFQVANGVVKHTNQPLPDTEALTISELADFILADEGLEMNLMLN